MGQEVFSVKKNSRKKLEEGCVLRKKLAVGSVQSQKHLTIPSQKTFKISVYPRRFVIVPARKREELVQTLDDIIRRLLTLINAKKTRTRVRLRAMEVLNELIRTSYIMIKDVEVEGLERETESLEEEERRPQGEECEKEKPAEAASE